MKSPTSVKNLLTAKNPNSNLRQLTGRVEFLRSLNTRLQQLLPAPLAQHCTIASLDQEKLVILTTSSAWATRLRLLHPKIIKAFSDFRVKSVTTQVAPVANQVHTRQATASGRRKFSQQTSKLLIELADSTSDPKLKSALKRLSKHGRKQT